MTKIPTTDKEIKDLQTEMRRLEEDLEKTRKERKHESNNKRKAYISNQQQNQHLKWETKQHK